MKPSTPNGYRDDVFLRLSDAPGSPLSPKNVEACWLAGAATTWHPVLVWQAAAGKNGGGNVPTSWDFRDLWAVPEAWGDPADRSSACWKAISDNAAVLTGIDVVTGNPKYQSVKAFPFTPRSFHLPSATRKAASSLLDPAFAAYLAALGQPGLTAVATAFDSVTDVPPDQLDALFTAGSRCPEDVKKALDAGKLDAVIRASADQPDAFCQALAAALEPPKATGMSGAEKAVAALATLGALALAARAYKRSKKRRR